LQGMQECGLCLEEVKTYALGCCNNKQHICKKCLDDFKKRADRTPTFYEAAWKTKPDYTCPFCRNDWSKGAILTYVPGYKEDLDARVVKSKRAPLLSKLALVVSATSSIAAIAKIYRCRSRNSQLISLRSALKKSQAQLLSVDFEQFDPVLAYNPLTHARSLEHWCSDIQDTTLRNRLAHAISKYEFAYNAAYTKIIASYYYRPASDFQEHEAQLVANLEHAATDVEALLIECVKKNALSRIEYYLISGAVVVAAISGYVATISPDKVVDLLGDLL
jgi:hypothetical protein